MKAEAFRNNRVNPAKGVLLLICLLILLTPHSALTHQAPTVPEPVVAIHVSELTQALETMPAIPPTPHGKFVLIPTGAGA